jgi:peptidoglycan/xylan/chitin deacetylase (PgdA/CDA1 family)/SAM-dependent methyltransferase
VFGRRGPGLIRTSAARRAALPSAAAAALLEAASVAGEPSVHLAGGNGQPGRVVYAPDLICRPAERIEPGIRASHRAPTALPRRASLYDRHHFEALFAVQPDPWRGGSPYARTKDDQTLSLLPAAGIGRALELACGEGHFTARLAPRVASLVATDISQIALDRAVERCAGQQNVRFMRLDALKDPLPGRFNLIVCSEVLYYARDLRVLRKVAHKLAGALEPGGYLITAHGDAAGDGREEDAPDGDVPFGAAVVGATLARTRSLRLLRELRTPAYRIQLFQRQRRTLVPQRHGAPEVIQAQSPWPPPRVAWRLAPEGGPHAHSPKTGEIVTDRLPILMYHRVAPTGAPALARYRVTPKAFETQLAYMREAGYYGVTLEGWRTAMEGRRPLAGRAVLFTFDDGYADFLTHAWPLLKRYGFSATVFLVADAIGGTSSWDRAYGEEVPLLGWREIRRLQGEGVDFGSHSATHRALTALSAEEIVRDGARARAALQRGLGVPVLAFAYPYGDLDPVVTHLVGACGYVYGLSCRSGRSTFQDPLLVLPRIEVTGSDSLQEFIGRLGA